MTANTLAGVELLVDRTCLVDQIHSEDSEQAECRSGVWCHADLVRRHGEQIDQPPGGSRWWAGAIGQ